MGVNMNCIFELEEKDFHKFLREVVEKCSRECFLEYARTQEFLQRLPMEYDEVKNRIYLSLLSHCITNHMLSPDNIEIYCEGNSTDLRIKNKNKLSKFIDVLIEQIFIDHDTNIHNDRRFHKVIYHEMELVVRNNTSIALIAIQLEDKLIMNPTLEISELHTFQNDILEFISIVKKGLVYGTEELYRMHGKEFMIISKELDIEEISKRVHSIKEEVMNTLQNIGIYFGITRITREQLLKDYNIVTYLEKVDQEVIQYKMCH
ncbi:MAG: hypothetical protein ACK5JH_16365 [Anaerocolumna sp.]